MEIRTWNISVWDGRTVRRFTRTAPFASVAAMCREYPKGYTWAIN